MKRSIARRLAHRKRRIKARLARANRDKYARSAAQAGPVLEASGVKYDLGDKARGIAYGGVGLMVKLAHEVGLVEAIDRRLHLLKVFYITNDREVTPTQIVFGCNDRCDQENLIAQLAGGVRALAAPVDNLVSNGAYMLMTSLAWTLKAWSALLLPVEPRKREAHQAERHAWLRMEFKTFVNAVMQIPCQIVRQARHTIYRVLHWNPYLPAFFRLCQVLRC